MLLARHGHSVLVVDRATFPSDVFSTHFVTAPGTALLERWGAIEPLQARDVPFFDHILLNVAGNVMNTSEVFGPRLVCSPRRTDLDTVLRDLAVEAGAEVRMATTVTDLLRDGDRVVGVALRDENGATSEERAHVVIGADGRTGIVARTVEPATRDEHDIHGSGLYAYFDDFDYVSENAAMLDGSFVFAFPTGPRSACIGTEVAADRLDEVRADPESTFMTQMACYPELHERVLKATRDGRWHMGDLPKGWFRHASGPGWAIAGDALCTKDPLTGRGISDAFISAELLAAAVHEGLAGDMDKSLARYDDAVWRCLQGIYEASRDAALDMTLPGDELFARFLPAQMLVAEEYDMVAAGGPRLDG